MNPKPNPPAAPAPLLRADATLDAAELGRRLAAERERLGLSRADVADRLGCADARINEWERGVRGVRAETLLRLAGLAGYDLGRILER